MTTEQTKGVMNQIRMQRGVTLNIMPRKEGAPRYDNIEGLRFDDIGWPEINEYFEGMFEASAADHESKIVQIPMVMLGPGEPGGSIMWKRKKRFMKKRLKWIELSKAHWLRRFDPEDMARAAETIV